MSDFESAKRSAKKNGRLLKLFILIIGWVLVLAMLFVTVTVISTAGLEQPVANVLALIAGLSIGYSVRRVVNYYGDKIDKKLGVVEP
jgi:flagellar basal body-associated protein FliL